MNKIVSLAIKKAVSEYNPKVEKVESDNRPDYSHLIMKLNFFKMIEVS